jgi:alkylhydroperoxidase/carboxymuconolactone decarboxylase family protein YurZ
MSHIGNVAEVLAQESLRSLRQAYDPKMMSAANVAALSSAYPPLRAWAEETSSTFFDRPGALAPKDRERCIITLLAYNGPALSLGVHVYWGLMEGLGVDEVCQAVALAGCYGGLPACARGLLVVNRVMALLQRVSEGPPCTPQSVLELMIREFQGNPT